MFGGGRKIFHLTNMPNIKINGTGIMVWECVTFGVRKFVILKSKFSSLL